MKAHVLLYVCVAVLGLSLISTVALSQVDSDPPDWFNQTQSAGSGYPGDSLNLRACWVDEGTADEGMLEINGTNNTWTPMVPVYVSEWVLVYTGPDPYICDLYNSTFDNSCKVTSPGPNVYECWCLNTSYLCNETSYDYAIPQTCPEDISWKIYGKDVFNNENVTDAMSFSIDDNDAPEWSDQGQGSDTIESGESVELSAKWSDCDMGDVDVYADTGNGFEKVGTVTPEDGWSNYTWSDSATGPVKWKLIGSDASGNQAETDEMQFQVQAAAGNGKTPATGDGLPQLVGMTVDKDVPKMGQIIEFQTSWTDDIGLSSAVLEIRTAGDFQTISTISLSGTSAVASFTWTVPSLAEGSPITWKVTATDTEGNSVSSPEKTFYPCPLACPQPSEWECDPDTGTEARTTYACDATTSGLCQSSKETGNECSAGFEWTTSEIILLIAALAAIALILAIAYDITVVRKAKQKIRTPPPAPGPEPEIPSEYLKE